MSMTSLHGIPRQDLQEAVSFVSDLTSWERRNFSRLREALNQQRSRHENLQSELERANASTPARVDDALSNARSCLDQLEEMNRSTEEQSKSISDHIKNNQERVDNLCQQKSQYDELQRLNSYISWIENIETISCAINSHLQEGAVGSACEEYSKLLQVSESLAATKCNNLRQFLEQTKSYWFDILTEKLSSEFGNVMKALKWPFTSGITAPSASNQKELCDRMEAMFCLLLKLQAPTTCASNTSALLLPLDLLLNPLRKRFRFHFYGTKKTNSLDKPEWYFTQILNWIKDHSDFLDHTIQPILNMNGFDHICAKTEFTRGLLGVCEEKMRHSLPSLIKDDDLFSHFVDEALLFEKEFRIVSEYPSSQPGCLHILTEKTDYLDKWLEVERTCSMHHVKSVVTSSGAWSLKYQEVADVDQTKVPECAESFITILQVMTDRYKGLPNLSHCLKFLAIQLELLAYYMTSLKSSAQENSVHPTSHHYCAVMNAVNYVTIMLQEWSDQMFFLQLSDHKAKCIDRSSLMESRSMAEDGRGEEDDVSVFSAALKPLEKLEEVMIDVLVTYVMERYKTKCKPYQQDRWHCLPSRKDLLLVSLSSSACDMMLYLKEELVTLEKQLAKTLFTRTWKLLANRLNQFMYNEVILVNHFNDGGALQLEYDMVKNLFLLFGEYTQKPENFFRNVKESCKLLSLLPGSAALLLDVLKRAETGDEDESSQPTPAAALNDIGVHKLTPQEAKNVLGLRLNWPNNPTK